MKRFGWRPTWFLPKDSVTRRLSGACGTVLLHRASQYAHSRSVSLPSIIKARLREIVAEGRLKATQWDDGRVISLVAAAAAAAASQCAQV